MRSISIKKIAPVLFAYFVMGFCDAVGISSNYIKQDYGLSETQANLLPLMVFLWFFFFSVPIGEMMNKIGQKRTVLISMVFTIISMFFVYLSNNFGLILFAFALLGIGNTILQVSLNPLLANVISQRMLTSGLTAGQFIKAICSFSAPLIAAFATSYWGNWKLMFPIFGLVTVLSTLWLSFERIDEKEQIGEHRKSLLDVFGLLKNRYILLSFLGIIFVVGVDIGINTLSPKLLIDRCNLPLTEAGFGASVYFIFRTLGAFVGAIILSRFSPIKIFRFSILVAFGALLALFFIKSQWGILFFIGLIGFSCANIFSIILGIALNIMPSNTNSISGLMVMGISGGAIIPPVMGFLTEEFNSFNGAILVIGICIMYLIYLSFVNFDNTKILVSEKYVEN